MAAVAAGEAWAVPRGRLAGGKLQLFLVALILCLAVPTVALNLPGVAPNYWSEGEGVTLKAKGVTSTKTPIQYNYYDLPFCKRRKTRAKAENLGDRLSGDTLTASPYEVSFDLLVRVSWPLCETHPPPLHPSTPPPHTHRS